MPSHDIENLWQRLESWLAVHAPDRLETLAPGATEEQIARVEAALSVALPADYKASCRIHDGQLDINDNLMDGREFLGLDRVQQEWEIWKGLLETGEIAEFESDPIGPIRNDWWNTRWIPITSDGAGDYDCLDLAPAQGGDSGQVIDFLHDDGQREVKARSFGSWLAAFVEGCELGTYVYTDDYGIIEKEMLALILAQGA